MVKMRQDGKVDNSAVYTAIGINMEGEKSVPGYGPTAPKAPSLDVCVDESEEPGDERRIHHLHRWAEGFPDAVEAVFPSALVQTCIVHLIRASLNFVNWKERKSMAAGRFSSFRKKSARSSTRRMRWDRCT